MANIRRANRENAFSAAKQSMIQANIKEDDQSEIQDEVKEANENKLIAEIVKSVQKKSSMQSRSFYMDDDIYEKLKKAAKSNKISASQMLNEILKKVL